MSNGSKCQCLDPATRLLRVVYADPAKRTEHDRGPSSFDRSTMFAACEPHRHSAKEILEKDWAEEIAAGEVVVLLGKKRKRGL